MLPLGVRLLIFVIFIFAFYEQLSTKHPGVWLGRVRTVLMFEIHSESAAQAGFSWAPSRAAHPLSSDLDCSGMMRALAAGPAWPLESNWTSECLSFLMGKMQIAVLVPWWGPWKVPVRECLGAY